MATIVTRAGKGSALTHNEVDANFTNLNTELATKANSASPSFTGKSQFPASTSTGAGINLGSGANVTSNLVDGDVWVEGSNLRWQASGTTWRASAVGHVHAISGVTGLQAALDLKVDKTSSTGAAALPASTTGDRPSTPAAGYIRYNTTTGKFEGYGSAWGNIGGGAAIGDTPPANPGAGDLWWNSADGRMYVYYTDANSSQWVDLSAGGAGQYLPLTGGAVTGNVTVTGNVGLGTTTPDARLSLQSGGDAVITLKDTSGTTRAYIGTDGAFGSAPTGALRIRSDQGGIVFGYQGVEQARIDASGRLTLPFQPRFSGYGWPYQTHGAYSPTGTVITPTGSNLNDGSCWNFSTHRFTAPVSGKYRIFFTGMNTTVSGGYPLNVGARVNGSTIVASSYTNGGTAYNRSVLETFVSLSANDYVQFCIFEGGLHEGWGSANIELIG